MIIFYKNNTTHNLELKILTHLYFYLFIVIELVMILVL